jgi:hypothetical protein
MPRKVAIVGKGGTFALAPWRDPSWEIWGMPWIIFPRITRNFDLHTQACWDQEGFDDLQPGWAERAETKYNGVPCYCDPSRMHAYPDAVEYPLAAVQQAMPIPYLENTIAYQIALALHEGVGEGDEIGLWGIHMMGRGEFVWQRPSVTYFIGLAQGRGVKITLPPGSPLFMSGYVDGRYGVSMNQRDISIITGWAGAQVQ